MAEPDSIALVELTDELRPVVTMADVLIPDAATATVMPKVPPPEIEIGLTL